MEAASNAGLNLTTFSFLLLIEVTQMLPFPSCILLVILGCLVVSAVCIPLNFRKAGDTVENQGTVTKWHQNVFIPRISLSNSPGTSRLLKSLNNYHALRRFWLSKAIILSGFFHCLVSCDRTTDLIFCWFLGSTFWPVCPHQKHHRLYLYTFALSIIHQFHGCYIKRRQRISK